ncbi:MAG: class I SAM-dependent methyltransferase [Methanosarcinales archaeon]|nr:MAG: class I SAM-dependent methyltransferase [Methanosarcinales archaeon]
MNAKSTVRAYWDKRSQTYDTTVYKSQVEAKQFWKTVLHGAIRTDKNLNILDVGTGTGFLALIFAEMGHNVTGIDISKHMLEKSRNNASKLGLTLNLMHGDAENLPFEDETFDIVINRYLLWTMPNPGCAVDEWRRVVKSGGKILLIDGNWYDSTVIMRFRRLFGSIIAFITEKKNPFTFMGYYARIKDQLPFFNGSTPGDIANLFAGAGLKNVSVNNLEKLREFENKNTSLSYKVSNTPSLFMALGEK